MHRKRRNVCRAAVMMTFLAVGFGASTARAWSRGGHMVTAAIAADALAKDHPEIIARAAALLAHHPDRGAFEVAAGDMTGEARARRLLLECARWPDDARGTAYDHPTWHYTERSVGAPMPAEAPLLGEAVEAFALNWKVLNDAAASDTERAVALCWVLHLAGDIHQPLHAAQLVSQTYPTGDRGGGLQFVIDPFDGQPISLHWFWDDIVSRTNDPEAARARADELEARFPRSVFPNPSTRSAARDFPAWRTESEGLAVGVAYGPAIPTGLTPTSARPVPADYAAKTAEIAQMRVALAGYRMADLLLTAFGERP